MATLLLGAAGAGIGYALGGPAGAWKGFQVGAAVGSYIDAANSIPKTDMGRVSDLRYGGSSYGSVLPRVWGEGRTAGMVIWAKEDASGNVLVEHEKPAPRGGGKGGGGGGTNFSYTATWATAFSQQTWYSRDPANPTGGELISRPVTALTRLKADDQIVYDSSNPTGSKWKLNEDFYVYPGSETQAPDSRIATDYGGSSLANTHRGVFYIVTDDVEVEGHLPNLEAEFTTAAVTLADVIGDMARCTGIRATDMDLTAGATTTVTGFTQMARSAPQGDIDALCQFYGFDLIEVDGLLKLVKRNGAAVATIPAADLGASLEGSENPRVKRVRVPRSELPGTVEVSYFDKALAYQNGLQRAFYRSADTYNVHTVSAPFVLTETEAAQGASRILDGIWNEGERVDIVLPMRWFKLAASDPILVPVDDGSTRRVRITSADMVMGEIRVSGVTDGENTSVQEITGDAGSGGVQPVAEIVPSLFMAWSGTEIRNEDQNAPGLYVAANGGEGWRGGTVWYSADGGTNWIQGPTITGRTVWGVTTSILSASGAVANAFDTTNTVGVNIAATGGVLYSVPDANVLAGENHFKVGSEILGAGTATLTGANAYTLSNLRRGERDSAMSGHASGEPFVQLSSNLVRVSVSEDLVGDMVQVKVVSPGETLADVTAVSVVIAPRTPSATEAALSALVRPVFITPVTLASGIPSSGATGWQTLNLSASIPADAQAVILQVEYYLQGTGEALEIQTRLNSSATAYKAVKVATIANATDEETSTVEVVRPVANQTMDWQRLGSGGTFTFRLLGYWSPVT